MTEVYNEILGKKVSLPEHPSRIVSLSPAITETLFMIGLGDRVVGVSAFCARPEEARSKRKVGSYSSTNLDVLRELAPDLILTITGYQRELGLKLSQEFPAYPLTLPVSVSGIIDTVVKVGHVVNEADRAWALASSLIRLVGSTKPVENKTKAYIEIDLGGPVSFGSYSYITDAFHLLGATTAYDDVRTEWLTPDLRTVATIDPDVIIYEAKMYSSFSQNDFKRLIKTRGWDELRAVREGHYFMTPGPLDFLAHHGPSFIIESIPWISDKLALSTYR